MDDRPPIAIVVPMEEEFLPYRKFLTGLTRSDRCGPWEVFEGQAGARDVVLAISDCGPANAAGALERLITGFHPEVVLSGGSAGAHAPELLPGDVVVGSSYRVLFPPSLQEQRMVRGRHPKGFRFRKNGRREHRDFLETPAGLVRTVVALAEEEIGHIGIWDGPGWPGALTRRKARVTSGIIGSHESWTTDANEIRDLHTFYGSLCEDMESAYLAQVCALHGLLFLAVRTISDNEARAALSPDHAPQAIALAGERSARVLARVAAEFRTHEAPAGLE
jgi:adenosylhomocysteine nucleosidase